MIYSKISFTGEYSVLESTIKSKIPEIQIKKIDDTSAASLVDNTFVDDLYYFKGLEMENNTVITSFEEDSSLESIFNKASEEINKLSSQVIEKANDIKENIAKNISSVKASSCSQCPESNLNKALINTTLKSKSPLEADDPMNYILSKSFILTTSITISGLIFISNLLF